MSATAYKLFVRTSMSPASGDGGRLICAARVLSAAVTRQERSFGGTNPGRVSGNGKKAAVSIAIAFRAPALALLTCAVLAQPGLGRDLPLALVGLTSPVHPGRAASITVQTGPRTQCMLLWHYKAGASDADVAVPKRADANGRVTWMWRVDPHASPGTWPVIVHCSDEFKGSVEQRRLELPFVVQ